MSFINSDMKQRVNNIIGGALIIICVGYVIAYLLAAMEAWR